MLVSAFFYLLGGIINASRGRPVPADVDAMLDDIGDERGADQAPDAATAR